jgi:ribonuclease VapC
VIDAVLDASAVLAFLLREPGGAVVSPRLPEAAITTVNLSEVAGYYARVGKAEPDIRAMLAVLPVARIEFDIELAFDAAMMAPLTKPAGLSLGDRSCLALARRLDVPALTADRHWLKIAQAVGATVELIR